MKRLSHRPLGTLLRWIAGALVLPALCGAAAAQMPDRTRYLVVFKASASDVRQQAQSLANGAGTRPDFVYEHAIKGFAVTLPTLTSGHFLEAMRRHPLVDSIEADQPVRHLQTAQSGAAWGLDRIDQRALPLDTLYRFTASGQGVQVHIVDTGIRATHTEFGARVLPGYTAVADGNGTQDCHGHGTHVAATAAGATYGVAKAATLVPVRVLGCTGSGDMSGVIAGLDWIAANATRPAVANLSLGGGVSSALDSAVGGVVSRGISVVVAAGNSNVDACTSSPARQPSALTVGASTSADARASYSNWGACLDLFAPGSSITSAGIAGDTALAVMSGTSMASPHVAGNVALLLQANPALAPSEVAQMVKSRSTPNLVTAAGTGSPNLLLYTGADSANRVVYVAGLSGARTLAKSNWTARATVTVTEPGGKLVSGATVAGRFSASAGTSSCVTSSAGVCTLALTLKNTVSSTVFSVSGMTGPNLSYDAALNAASSVTISK